MVSVRNFVAVLAFTGGAIAATASTVSAAPTDVAVQPVRAAATTPQPVTATVTATEPLTVSAAAANPEASQYTWLMKQPTNPALPVRWDPCQTITWAWPTGTPNDKAFTRTAFTELSKRSGMSFKEVTGGQRITFLYGPKPAGVLATGGFTAVGYSGYQFIATAGKVTASTKLSSYSSAVRYSTFLHELGHVVGLGHVTSKQEIMYPYNTGRLTFGLGDLAGLTKVGKPAGCVGFPSAATNIHVSRTPSGMAFTWTQPGYANLVTTTVRYGTYPAKAAPKGATTVTVPGSTCQLGNQALLTSRSVYGEKTSTVVITAC